MAHMLHSGVIGGAAWPRKETTVVFAGRTFVLKPATRDTEQSIHVKLDGISASEAQTQINRFLSVLSWSSDQAMENLYGWSSKAPILVPYPHRKRLIGSSDCFQFHRNLEASKESRLALALYREGLTVNSIPFQFLSFFKILNIFWKDTKGKDEKENELVRKLREVLPQITDKQVQDRIIEIQSSGHEVAAYLWGSCRCAIAHAYDKKKVVDPDDVSDLRRLSQDMVVIKAVASHLISSELGVSGSMTNIP